MERCILIGVGNWYQMENDKMTTQYQYLYRDVPLYYTPQSTRLRIRLMNRYGRNPGEQVLFAIGSVIYWYSIPRRVYAETERYLYATPYRTKDTKRCSRVELAETGRSGLYHTRPRRKGEILQNRDEYPAEPIWYWERIGLVPPVSRMELIGKFRRELGEYGQSFSDGRLVDSLMDGELGDDPKPGYPRFNPAVFDTELKLAYQIAILETVTGGYTITRQDGTFWNVL